MQRYNFAFIDENAKREVRRGLLKAVAIPGYQVPFASPELPIARGWGTGGLLITLSVIGSDDVLKVIDQGADDGVNAVNLREFIAMTTGVKTSSETDEATLIQTRHRIPEAPLGQGQILVFQVPYPDPFYRVEPGVAKARELHAEMDYSKLWVGLYEDIVQWGEITIGAQYPMLVNDRYVMNPSPIPRWDCPRLDMADCLYLFGAGREKRLYAVPPHTRVVPLEFEDVRFRVEDFAGKACAHCGATGVYLDEVWDAASAERYYACSDTSNCAARQRGGGARAAGE